MGKSKSLLSKIPRWKYWLSHIFEITLERTGSQYNPELNLCLEKGRLQLYTQNAIYSFEDLYDNFTKTFDQLDLGKKDFDKILVLGFGLGSVPYMLEKKFGIAANYIGVEIDEEIIRLASHYALPKLQSPCTLFTADAFNFVETVNQQFDMVVVDVFIDNVIPDLFEAPYFLNNVKELLAEDGLLLYNRLTATKKDKERHKEFFENTFKPIFREAVGIEIEDNTILLNIPTYLSSKP